MLLFVKTFVLAFSALLPVINPLGSALLFLGVVRNVPPETFRKLARKVAICTIFFLIIIELMGAALLAFFGISLPVVQLAGGFVLAAMGWKLLDREEPNTNSQQKSVPANGGPVEDKIFYPLTFPITAGPGCIVVTVTLSAHASQYNLLGSSVAHAGVATAIVLLGFIVMLAYSYAPKITQKIAPQTVTGILRVIAFVLLCIGVQIAKNGLQAMIHTVPQ